MTRPPEISIKLRVACPEGAVSRLRACTGLRFEVQSQLREIRYEGAS